MGRSTLEGAAVSIDTSGRNSGFLPALLPGKDRGEDPRGIRRGKRVSPIPVLPSRPNLAHVAAVILLTIGTVSSAAEPTTLITVVGASGAQEYGQQFAEWERRWQTACASAEINYISIGTDSAPTLTTDRDRLKSSIDALAGESGDSAWIVFIGHGTSFGEVSNFNLRGPDVSANDLADWLSTVRRPLVIINCSSCSGPFLSRLSGDDRVIMTATRSGAEQNYCRFGNYLSSSISDPAADLDHDQQVSLLEAFLTASRNTQRFYDEESRLASEHAMIDDNGDGLGTSAEFFSGIRVAKSSATGASVDGLRAHQCFLVRGKVDLALSRDELAQRDRLEQRIEELRIAKTKFSEDEYYQRMETIMLELAKLYSKKNDD
jgi:hypothetical protein